MDGLFPVIDRLESFKLAPAVHSLLDRNRNCR